MVGFYVLSLVAIWASLRVVTHANAVHAILSMIVSLLAVAGIFFILGAPFAGILEIIVYAGAILVLFVFVIMMLNLGTDTTEEKNMAYRQCVGDACVSDDDCWGGADWFYWLWHRPIHTATKRYHLCQRCGCTLIYRVCVACGGGGIFLLLGGIGCGISFG